MKTVNELKMTVDSKSVNEGFSRVAIGAFIACLDPDIEELNDVKTDIFKSLHGDNEIFVGLNMGENSESLSRNNGFTHDKFLLSVFYFQYFNFNIKFFFKPENILLFLTDCF